MNKFIRLSNIIINSSHIKNIIIENNSYSININNINLFGYFIFQYGSIDSENKNLFISKEKSPEDYNTISKWIKSLES
jgi:hypothetical protein